jgi:hypothetical protein
MLSANKTLNKKINSGLKMLTSGSVSGCLYQDLGKRLLNNNGGFNTKDTKKV